MLKRHILVADSEFESRLAVSAALAGTETYSIDTVSNGLAALARISDGPPDMLLMASHLSGVGSLELCKAVRESYSFPVVLYSGPHELAFKLEAFDCGVDDYVTKGTEFDEILARVKAALRRSEPVRSGDRVDTPLSPGVSNGQPGFARKQRRKISGAGAKLASKLTLRYRKRPRSYELGSQIPVLVADPDAKEREHACRHLKRFGYVPMESDSAAQTLLTIKKYDPQLVLVELAMPDLSGLELVSILKNHPRTINTGVVVVSAIGDPDTVQTAHELKIDDYIIKPWQPDEFEIRIRWTMEALTKRAAS